MDTKSQLVSKLPSPYRGVRSAAISKLAYFCVHRLVSSIQGKIQSRQDKYKPLGKTQNEIFVCYTFYALLLNVKGQSKWSRQQKISEALSITFAKVIYLLFMPELSIAQLVGIYISLLCFVFCLLCFVSSLIKMNLERHLGDLLKISK